MEANPNDWVLLYRRARAEAGAGQLVKAVADYTRVIHLQPDSWRARYDRALAHSKLRNWTQAGVDFTKATELGADDVGVWEHHALARLSAGEKELYCSACKSMLDRFGQTEHVSIADTVAGTCVLAPDALADFEQLVQLAERVWGNPRNRAYLGTLGAALYRAGRFEAALARLSEAANMPSHKGTGRNSLFLAMAHQRLGHAEEAHKWLDRAVLWIEQAPASGPSLSWTQRAQLTILRGEAEGLLKKTPDSAK